MPNALSLIKKTPLLSSLLSEHSPGSSENVVRSITHYSDRGDTATVLELVEGAAELHLDLLSDLRTQPTPQHLSKKEISEAVPLRVGTYL